MKRFTDSDSRMLRNYGFIALWPLRPSITTAADLTKRSRTCGSNAQPRGGFAFCSSSSIFQAKWVTSEHRVLCHRFSHMPLKHIALWGCSPCANIFFGPFWKMPAYQNFVNYQCNSAKSMYSVCVCVFQYCTPFHIPYHIQANNRTRRWWTPATIGEFYETGIALRKVVRRTAAGRSCACVHVCYIRMLSYIFVLSVGLSNYRPAYQTHYLTASTYLCIYLHTYLSTCTCRSIYPGSSISQSHYLTSEVPIIPWSIPCISVLPITV